MSDPTRRRGRWRRRLLPLVAASALTLGVVGPAAAADGGGPLGSLGSSGSLGSAGGDNGGGDNGGGGASGGGGGAGNDTDDSLAPDVPITTNLVPNPETIIVDPGQVTSIIGEYGEQQTIVFTPEERVPQAGDYLVVNAGVGVPYGTVGKVVAVETLGSGLVRVTITPAGVDEAYATFDVNTTVTGADAVLSDPGEGAPAQRVTPRSAGAAGRLSIPSRFTCEDSKPFSSAFTVDGYIDDISVDTEFSANAEYHWFRLPEYHPYFKAVVTATAHLNIGFEASGSIDCKLKDSAKPSITIPVAGPITAKISPFVTFEGGFDATAHANWSKTMTSGFELRDNDVHRIEANGEDLDVDAGSAVAGSVEFTAGGQATIGLNGPSLPGAVFENGATLQIGGYADLDGHAETADMRACISAEAGGFAGLKLKATNKVFGQGLDWEKTLATKRFWNHEYGPFCIGGDGSGGDSTGGDNSDGDTPGHGDDGVSDPGGSGTDAPPETRPGELTGLQISPNLQCRVNSPTDGRSVYYGGDSCATDVAVDGVSYGYSFGAGTRSLTPVSQNIAGDGSATNPLVVTTVAKAGDTGITLTQVDTFVDGHSGYLTRITVGNDSTAAHDVILYRAADCYLNRSDYGVGAIHNRSVACVSPNGRSITWTDQTGDATLQEGHYGTIWGQVANARMFDGTVVDTNHDNGAGLSWSTTLDADQSKTFVSRFELLEPADVAQRDLVLPRLAPGPDVKEDSAAA